jgi:hypothetical protein
MTMKKTAIPSDTFSARIEAVELLLEAPTESSGERLRQVADRLDGLSLSYGRVDSAVLYAAFAEAARTIAMLCDWRAHVLGALPDADRFRTAALERHGLWLREYSAKPSVSALVDALGSLDAIEVSQVPELARRLGLVPLPVGIYSNPFPIAPSIGALGVRREVEARDEVELAVAFLSFKINGAPASDIHLMIPNKVHDLDIEVRVSRWPEGATFLAVQPISIESPSTYDFPAFSLPAPRGTPPFIIRGQGRAYLKVAQSFNARPFEFRYAAQFLPFSSEQPVAVIGHRTLRIESIDLNADPITGYPAMDRGLLALRDQLRQTWSVDQDDLRNSLLILTVLGSLAARAVQDALFKGDWPEAKFQAFVRDELRRNPLIAADLLEHAHAGGGITDLSFRRIPIELKAGSVGFDVTKCEGFADQTTSYAVAMGKRIGLLAVLDMSPKAAPPRPAESGICILNRGVGNQAVSVVTVLVQGNLSLPSDLA